MIYHSKFTVHGKIPSKANTYIPIAKGKMIKSKAVKAAEGTFMMQLTKVKPLTGLFGIDLVVYISKNQDTDNTLKFILDCLQKAEKIENDRDCMEIRIKKVVTKDNHKVDVILYKYQI